MYPKEIIAGIDLYTVFLGIAVVAAIVVLRICADKMKLGARLQNFIMISAVVSVIVGYYSAVFFQALYNIKDLGEFKISSDTGATFYGGLIGGALCFTLVFFLAGRIWYKDAKLHTVNFFKTTNIAAASISVAHAFGRIGCLMAGCCHGKVTDAWYGIYMETVGERVVPIQLFEAIFLFLLFAFFLWRIFNNKIYNLPIYMGAYGIWRFIIEEFRDDYRGSTLVDGVTPSQLIALLMLVGAVALFFVEKHILLNLSKRTEASNDVEQE